MKKVTYVRYEADDGRIFNTVEECQAHEKEMGEYLLFNEHGERTNSIIAASVIITFTSYAAETLQQRYDPYNICLPWDERECAEGIWIWDENNTNWVEFPSSIQAYLRIARTTQSEYEKR